MNGVVSPYHLSTREPALFAALMLFDGLVTYLPTPRSGLSKDHVRAAFKAGPRYEQALRGWLWSAPLWQQGVIQSGVWDPVEPGHRQWTDPEPFIRAASVEIRKRPAFAGLAGYVHDGLFGDRLADAPTAETKGLAPAGLDLVGADLLKGGPDPGIALPICAGLDAFAAARALISVRSGGRARTPHARSGTRPPGSHTGVSASIAQRAEARLATEEPGLTFAVSIPIQAGAGTVCRFRDALQTERQRLAQAVMAAVYSPTQTPQLVRASAADFSRAVEQTAAQVGTVSRDDGTPVVISLCRLTLCRLAPDVALTAAAIAARSIGLSGRARERMPEDPASRVMALTVEPMLVQPGSGVPARSEARPLRGR